MAAETGKAVDEASEPLVLLVEDEPLIRLATADALRFSGFRVVEAANGDEAVALLRSGVRPHIVFTDVRMPGETDGLTLLSFVAENAPFARVFVTSAHLTPDEAARAGLFIQKPYPAERVAEMFKAAIRENDSTN